MTIESVGEVEFPNEANVPVNSFIHEPDEDSDKWTWTADNFMPRKGYCGEGAYKLEADNREEIVEWVIKFVVPIYLAAVTNLSTIGANYYWEPKKQTETGL
jgi:deoxyhypusine synthase